jgi:putative heme transporter
MRRHRADGMSRLWRIAVAIAVAVAVASQWHTLVGAGQYLGRVSPWWLAVAGAAEVISFVFAAELQHHLLAAAQVHVTRSFLIALEYASTAVSAVLPAGAAFSTGYSYRRLVQQDASPGTAAWVLIASGVVSVAMLVALGLLSVMLRGFVSLWSLPGIVVAILVVAAVGGGVALLAQLSAQRSRFDIAAAWVAHVYERACQIVARRRTKSSEQNAARVSVQRSNPIALGPWGWVAACGLGTGNWLTDWIALVASFVALGFRVPWDALPWAYVATQIVGSLPLLGCIGLAEGSMTVTLLCAGVPAAHALAVVVIFRLVTFWVTLPVGWLAYRRLGRREAATAPPVARAHARAAAQPGTVRVA